MNKDEIKQFLEAKERVLPKKEFFALIFELLENNPTQEMRWLLKPYLLAYSYIDKDRVVRYLEPFLSDPDPFQREVTVLDLLVLARKPDDLAYKILSKFLGEEPMKDKKDKIVAERLWGLFPKDDM